MARLAWLGGALLAAGIAAGPARALSGNEQVALAGAGRFEDLATGMERLVDSGATLKSADWHAMCFAYSRTKRYDRIFPCLDRLAASMAAGDRRTRLFGLDDGTAVTHIMRAEALIELGRHAEALTEADHALRWHRREKSDDHDILVDALAARVLALLATGERRQAEAAAAELDAVRLGFLQRESVSAKALASARAHMALGNWQKVLDALESDSTYGLRRFFDNVASGAYLRGEDQWLWLALPRAYMQTRALLELGRLADARRRYDDLLAIPQVRANGAIHWLALQDRGRVAELDNQPAAAESFYRAAADVIDQQRLTIHSETNKIGFAGNKLAVYERLVAVQLAQGKLDEAFTSVERGKSRALVDLLAQRSGAQLVAPGQAGAAAQVAAIGRIREADLLRVRQHSGVAARSAPASAQALASELPGALASLVSVSTMQLAEARELLAPDEALLVYFGQGEALQVLLVQRDGIHAARLAAAGLEERIRKLRAAIQKGEPVRQELQALHALLIAPVAPQLRAAALTIVPHGPLHYLPFAALNDGERDLIDRFSLRMLPSVSALKYLRRPSAPAIERLLVLGNPDLDDAALDLPGAQQEAQKLATRFRAEHLLLRKQATGAAFRALAPAARFIHVASHGEFQGDRPLESGLALAAAPPAKGVDRLTVADLYGLRLDAELVTLSACETGLGRVMSGDDVVGLTRGFLYAGASAVVASLWLVDDDATELLMERMYGHWTAGAGRDALRRAQLETRARFPHPVYWAAFYRTGAQ